MIVTPRGAIWFQFDNGWTACVSNRQAAFELANCSVFPTSEDPMNIYTTKVETDYEAVKTDEGILKFLADVAARPKPL